MLIRNLCAFFLLEEIMRVKSLLKRILAGVLVSALLVAALSVFSFAADFAVVFGNYVAAIDDTKSLDEKIEYIDGAKAALTAYINAGGSETDAAVAENYARFLLQQGEIEAEILLCYEFINIVNAIWEPGLSYDELLGYITDASELLEQIEDKSYSAISSYVSNFKSEKISFESKVEVCETYVGYAKAAAEAATYADSKQNIDAALLVKSNIEFLDYPLLDQAEQYIETARAIMYQKNIDADVFVKAVKNIGNAESIPAGIKAAYAVLEEYDIDVTADGADEAMRTLKTHELSYNRKVVQSNDVQEQTAEFVFDILF